MTSRATRKFWDNYAALPASVKREALKAFELFQADPSHPGLCLKRLRCDPNSWCVRISRDYRAVGTKQGDTMIWFWIGNHRDFDRAFPA